MKKEFNTEGNCIPEMHYMVDLSSKLEKIFPLIEKGKYFTINRPRQYGKTTVLSLLSQFLKEKKEYHPIQISFEGLGVERYQSEASFSDAFLSLLRKEFLFQKRQDLVQFIQEKPSLNYLDQLGDWITELVGKVDKKVVLLIDEVDKSSNNQLFLDFLGVLRNKYLAQRSQRDLSFHSVVLVGVHDVKNLKRKIQSEQGTAPAPPQYNSP